MFGINVTFNCIDCGISNNDHLGITTVYSLKGKGSDFAKLKCKKCGTIHFVHTSKKNRVFKDAKELEAKIVGNIFF